MREPSDSAAAAADVFAACGGRWALVGALAALRYRATPRLTTDADFLADDVDGLDDAFKAAGYEVMGVGDPGEQRHLLVVRGRGDQIDVLFPVVEYQEVALDRAKEHVITAEDVIIHKLIAWRPRDRNDIASILEAGVELDDDYIRRWAGQWQVLDRWDEARASR